MTQEAAARGRALERESMWAPAGREQHRVAIAQLQQLLVQEAVDSMVKSLERENIWERCRASCSAAVPAVVRTARRPCSKCTSALRAAMHLWLKPRPW